MVRYLKDVNERTDITGKALYLYQQFKNQKIMEKYSKAVREMYSQFKQRKAHPMEKYIGRHASRGGQTGEVVGYNTRTDVLCSLILDASDGGGPVRLRDGDVIVKECKSYLYASIYDLTD